MGRVGQDAGGDGRRDSASDYEAVDGTGKMPHDLDSIKAKSKPPRSPSPCGLLDVAVAPSIGGGAAAAEAPFCLLMHGKEEQALAAALVRDTVGALPCQPERISDVRGPFLALTKVEGDDLAVDVEVRHHFRAHFAPGDGGSGGSSAAPASLEPRVVELAASDDEGGCGSAEELPFTQDLAHLPPRDASERALAAAEPRRPPAPFEVDPEHVLLGDRLAVGGFAEVFMGKYMGTLVAVKLLLNVDAAARRRFSQEVALMASLRHPNLLLFMGYTCAPHPAIVSEFMHRGSLFKVLRRGGDKPLEPRLQRSVAVAVARGMAYLHSRAPPLLHLDLKSPNILIDDKWRVKIADFGLARVRYSTFLSGAGAGTPEWMAPEMLRSEPHNEKADVYSYGVVLWEVLTGQAPWEGLHPMQVVGAVGFQGRTLPLPSNADPVLTDLARRCMSAAPAQRPAFADIVLELEREYAPAQLSSIRSTLSEMSEVMLRSESESVGATTASTAGRLPALLGPRPETAALEFEQPEAEELSTPFAAAGPSLDTPFAQLPPFSSAAASEDGDAAEDAAPLPPAAVQQLQSAPSSEASDDDDIDKELASAGEPVAADSLDVLSTATTLESAGGSPRWAARSARAPQAAAARGGSLEDAMRSAQL